MAFSCHEFYIIRAFLSNPTNGFAFIRKWFCMGQTLVSFSVHILCAHVAHFDQTDPMLKNHLLELQIKKLNKNITPMLTNTLTAKANRNNMEIYTIYSRAGHISRLLLIFFSSLRNACHKILSIKKKEWTKCHCRVVFSGENIFFRSGIRSFLRIGFLLRSSIVNRLSRTPIDLWWSIFYTEKFQYQLEKKTSLSTLTMLLGACHCLLSLL